MPFVLPARLLAKCRELDPALALLSARVSDAFRASSNASEKLLADPLVLSNPFSTAP